MKMKVAICVGINYSKTSTPLTGPEVDSKNISDLCIKHYNYLESNVHILDETNGTKKNILKYFKKITSLPNGSSALFSYSGHGKQVKDKNGDEIDKKDEAICPIKNGKLDELTDDEINEYLIKPLPKGVKLTCIFDCCNSGTICDLRYVIKDDSGNLVIQKDKNYPKIESNVCTICACRDNQSSLDGPYGGLFTNNLLMALEKFNYQCSYADLYKNLSYRFSDGPYNPLMCFSQPPNLDDFFII